MSEQLFKGQYVVTAIWGVSSILFFNHISMDWMKVWLKVSLGILQLTALAYMTLKLHGIQHKKSRLLLVLLCVDILVTIIALIHYCSI